MKDNPPNKCDSSQHNKSSRRTKGMINDKIRDKGEETDIIQEIERLKLKLEIDFQKYSNSKSNKPNKEEKHKNNSLIKEHEAKLNKSKNPIEHFLSDEQSSLSPIIIHKIPQSERLEENKADNIKGRDNIDNKDNNIQTIRRFNTISDIPDPSQPLIRQDKQNEGNTFNENDDSLLNIEHDKVNELSIDNNNLNCQSQVPSSAQKNKSNLFNQKAESQPNLPLDNKQTKQLEQDKNMDEIQIIESQLTIDERLSHENREIRKNACREISQMCNEAFSEETKRDFFDCFSPWVKYCIEETNSYVLQEALNFFIVFNSTFPEFQSSSQKDFFENLERIASFGISTLNELCSKIILIFIQDKKLFNQAFNELMKGLDKSSIRLIKFLIEFLFDIITKGIINDTYVKMVFEKAIQVYLSINLKNAEKKKVCGKLVLMIYNIIDDDVKTIKQYVHIPSIKDFDSLLSKGTKSSNLMFSLYPKTMSDDAQFVSPDYTQDKKKDNVNPNIVPSTRSNETNSNTENTKLANDLCAVLPSNFFEFNFLTLYNEKMSLLEEANNIFSKIEEVKDKDKNYTEIYKIINYSIDDSNILIHLEGIKLFGHISRLLQSKINIQKAKALLETCFDKFKDKKSIIKNELFNVFDIIIENECMNVDTFITFVLSLSLNNIKKAVPIVKQGILEYLKILLKNTKNTIKELLHIMNEKACLNHAKIAIDIILSESQSNIKDLCTDLLTIFKSKIESKEGNTNFESLIKKLPNHRKSQLLSYQSNINNSGQNGNYKKNLTKIKSTISFSTCKSMSKDKQIIIEKKDTKSLPKNDKLNCKQPILNNKAKKLPESREDNSKKQTTNIKLIKNNKNIPTRKSNSIQKDSNDGKYIQESISKDSIDNDQQRKKQDILAKRKDDISNHIDSLDKKSLDEYSKVIVRDFLCFVNKISTGELKENLSFHFEVIIDILNKILKRMLFLNSIESNDKHNHKVITENISNRIIKIMIIAPCISQIESTSNFDKDLFTGILKILKQSDEDEETHLLYLLVNLIKFSQQRKGFLEKIDPKPAILFFLGYIQSFQKLNNKLRSMMNEFIDETSSLTREEKTKYQIEKRSPNLPSYFSINEVDEFKHNKNPTSVTETNSGGSEVIIKETKTESNYEILSKKVKESEITIKMKLEENENLKKVLRNYEEQHKEQEHINIPSHEQEISFITVNQSDISNENNKIEDGKKHHKKPSKNDEIQKIKEQLDHTTKKLDITLKKMIEKSEKKEKSFIKMTPQLIPSPIKPKQESQQLQQLHQLQSSQQSHQLQSSQQSELLHPLQLSQQSQQSQQLHPLQLSQQSQQLHQSQQSISSIQQIRNLEDCLNIQREKDQSLLNTDHNISEIQQWNNQDQFQTNSNSIQEILITNTNINTQMNYKQLMNQLLSVTEESNHQTNLDDILVQLTELYHSFQTADQKTEYVANLKQTIDQKAYIDKTSSMIFSQIYEYVLTILSFEILLTPNNENIIVSLQSIAEDLKSYRGVNEMILLILFLIRKHFPQSIDNDLTDYSLVMLKITTYLIKELIKLISNPNSQINQYEIISEINELFITTSIEAMITITPTIKIYEQIFIVIKCLTDEVYYLNKIQFKEVVEHLYANKIPSRTFGQYLKNLCQA